MLCGIEEDLVSVGDSEFVVGFSCETDVALAYLSGVNVRDDDEIAEPLHAIR